MAIIGFSLTKLLLERKEAPIRKLEVKSRIQIPSMEKQKVQILQGEDTLKFDFEYNIEYSPELANILFKGFILFSTNSKDAEEITKEWSKNKRVSQEVQTYLYNYIFKKCNIKALQLEDEFNLPPHIQLPQIKLTDPKEKK